MDKFFDCLNVRNTTEHVFKRKPFLMPYSEIDDPSFTWLDQFLDYFSQWKESIERRQGEFSANVKTNMFISWQTYKGLQTCVLSFKEVCRFLLQNGVTYVLSNRFCQVNKLSKMAYIQNGMILTFYYYDKDAVILKCSIKMKYIFQYFQPCCICNHHSVKFTSYITTLYQKVKI